MSIVHWGDQGGVSTWERPSDLRSWSVVARSLADWNEDERFFFEDRDFLYTVAPLFYRAVGGVPECAVGAYSALEGPSRLTGPSAQS